MTLEEEILPLLKKSLESSDDKICPVACSVFINERLYIRENVFRDLYKENRDFFDCDIQNRTEFFYNEIVKHAEMELIGLLRIHKEKLKGLTLYTTLFPCDKCAKVLIGEGIKEVVYLEDHPEKGWSKRSKELLNKAKVEYRKFNIWHL